MGLKIIISSAVELKEKEIVKDKLKELEDLHLLKTDEVYDCKDHATLWGVESKQEAINRKILSADWFICLIPEQTVGNATWGELKLVLKAHHSGAQIAISVFHPKDFKETKTLTDSALSNTKDDSKERVSFNFIKQEAKRILDNKEEQYWVSYDNTDEADLPKQLHMEFKRLYYTDKVFRTQHLNGLSKLGGEIQAHDIYFDKERANANNGFFENKYFPRKSVDGKLQEALFDKRKFIILLGAPGSGKTRSVYQLMTDPQRLTLAHSERYSLGILANQRIVIVNQDNIRQVYDFLESEKDFNSLEQVLSEYYLICDQIKDVFGMLNNDELFRFFDMVAQYHHVHMIATSIPSAFRNFNERWKDYGRKPMEDDQLTKTIIIPPISSDEEESALRNWMLIELQGSSEAETIGDYIPKLNQYKQGIVERLYKKAHELPCLPEFLSALQVTETFRHDTALFLAVLIARKNLYPREVPLSWKDFNHGLKETVNFLIANNIIWIRKKPLDNGKEAELIKELQDRDFSLEYGMGDDEEEFAFDGEVFRETPISTSYTYGINEIVWNELEQEDSARLLKGKETLLKDFQNVRDVVKSAKEFYRTFPHVKSLRRILPRIPHTDCYDAAAEKLWQFVYEECAGREPQPENKEELLLAIGMLIGRSKDIEHLKHAIAIIQDKGLMPDYSIIGELYSAGLRLDNAAKAEIDIYVSEIRERYHLCDNNFFSLARQIMFLEMSFDDAMKMVTQSKYSIRKKSGNVLLPLENIVDVIEGKVELASLERLFVILAKKVQTTEQWIEMFNLHKSVHVKLRRATIRQYFAVVANESIRLSREGTAEDYDLMKKYLLILLERFDDIIVDEDKISGYYFAIEASWNFRQSSKVYELYVQTFQQDNPRMISMLLRTAKNHEFQMALSFLRVIDTRLKEQGSGLNTIIFNNLIKSAPNMGEAMAVVPFITHLQDHTLANILNILKEKRTIENSDSKTGRSVDDQLFYYAYSVAMRPIFFEQRKSPYIIGLMYNLATTAKHERFIRDTFLGHLSEKEKRKLIDYASGIASIRMQKKYRTLDEVWDIFNTCRNRLNEEKMHINSELYSSLMSKINSLCKDDELTTQREKIRVIIKADSSHIIRDEHFIPTLYQFFPDKEIIDNNGKISESFLKEMEQSKVEQVKLLNQIMLYIMPHGFDAVWNFYEFIVDYYQQHGKWKTLRPDIRTVTCLMEAVTTKAQFDKAEAASRRWCAEEVLRNNIYFWKCHEAKKREFGLDTSNDIEKRASKSNSSKPDKSKHSVSNSDYKQRTDEIINLAAKEIDLFGSLTPTILNRYLKDICNIVDDIKKDPRSKKMVYKRKVATYRNVLSNLIDKYRDCLTFDALSYVYLTKLTPGKQDVKRWIDGLREKEDVYKLDMVLCRTIATNNDVCRADIDIALDYFEFWEDIFNDIGYDPSDPTSVSETTKISKYNDCDDYDGYWRTRGTHCIREMMYYWQCLKQKNGFVDKEALRVIKRQMGLFERYNVPFPLLKNKSCRINFKDEIGKLDY